MEYRLGELIESISETSKIEKDKVVLINTSDIENGKVLNHTYVDNKNLRGQFKKRFKEGDILYSEIRPKNKRFAYIDFDSTNYIASTKLMVLRNKGKINNKYLFLLLTSKKIIEYLQMVAESRSGTFPQITFEELSNVIVNVLNLESQNKIVNIIDAIDKKIELNNKINDNLLKISQNLYENYINTNKDIIYKKIRELNPILESGKRPNGGVSNIKDGIPSVGAENVKKLGYYDYSKTKYVTEEFFNKMKKGILKGYEVLIYKDGGKPGWFIPNFSIFGENFPFDKCAINEHVLLLDFNDIEYNCFAYYYFNSSKVRHRLHVLGSKSAAIPGINQQDVLDLEIPYSESKEFKNLSNILKLNTQKILKNSYQNRTLEQLKDIMLPKLMNGEIGLDKIEI